MIELCCDLTHSWFVVCGTSASSQKSDKKERKTFFSRVFFVLFELEIK